jgi:hypothetical protein
MIKVKVEKEIRSSLKVRKARKKKLAYKIRNY